jgi:hypothetical protein
MQMNRGDEYDEGKSAHDVMRRGGSDKHTMHGIVNGHDPPSVTCRWVANWHTLMVECTTTRHLRECLSTPQRDLSSHYRPWCCHDSAPRMGPSSGLADGQKETKTSSCISWCQVQPIPTTCYVRCHIASRDHHVIRQPCSLIQRDSSSTMPANFASLPAPNKFDE